MATKLEPPTRLPLISRQSSFSAGRRLHRPEWSEAENRAHFGRDVMPHGHDYVLQAAYAGEISEVDGMIANLSDIKPAISGAVSSLDGRFLDQDVPEFRENPPTAENIALYIWRMLPKQVGGGTLSRLRLQESRRLRVEVSWDETDPNAVPRAMKVTRAYEFAAAHRLYTPALSDAENAARFDKCSNPAGHGHNYQLEVTVQGEPSTETGFVISPAFLDKIVDAEIYERFDHKHLNVDCPEFTTLVPTSENLARVIFDILQARLREAGYKLAKIGLHETQKNYFEVEA